MARISRELLRQEGLANRSLTVADSTAATGANHSTAHSLACFPCSATRPGLTLALRIGPACERSIRRARSSSVTSLTKCRSWCWPRAGGVQPSRTLADARG
jgi:hypothetical protein